MANSTEVEHHDAANRRQIVHVRALSAASVDAVWPLLADVTTWPDWSSFGAAAYSRDGDPPPHGVGAQRAFRVGIFRSIDTVLLFEPPTRLSYDYRGPLPIEDYRADVELIATDTGSVIVWQSEFVTSFPMLGGLMRLLLRKVLRDLATGLARAAEQAPLTPSRSGLHVDLAEEAVPAEQPELITNYDRPHGGPGNEQ